MPQTFIAAYDGSSASRAAVQLAVELAAVSGRRRPRGARVSRA